MNFLKKKISLGKMARYSGIVWLASIVGFGAIVALATNFFSGLVTETNFGKSDAFLVLFLGFIATGVIAFALMFGFGMLSLIFEKGEAEKSTSQPALPFGLSTKKLLLVLALITWSILLVLYGRLSGLERGFQVGKEREEELVAQLAATPLPTPTPLPKPVQEVQPAPQQVARGVSWGGPELWEAVNKRRVENGVNPLGNKGELCTIAAIRLSELLELGKLDAHEGFGNMPERRPDLKWIFEKYRVYEFLVAGYPTPEETVVAWEHTLGHRSLLAGGEFVWGCIYAANTFAVAITAF